MVLNSKNLWISYQFTKKDLYLAQRWYHLGCSLSMMRCWDIFPLSRECPFHHDNKPIGIDNHSVFMLKRMYMQFKECRNTHRSKILIKCASPAIKLKAHMLVRVSKCHSFQYRGKLNKVGFYLNVTTLLKIDLNIYLSSFNWSNTIS